LVLLSPFEAPETTTKKKKNLGGNVGGFNYLGSSGSER
jgi:hypothetical protein